MPILFFSSTNLSPFWLISKCRPHFCHSQVIRDCMLWQTVSRNNHLSRWNRILNVQTKECLANSFRKYSKNGGVKCQKVNIKWMILCVHFYIEFILCECELHIEFIWRECKFYLYIIRSEWEVCIGFILCECEVYMHACLSVNVSFSLWDSLNVHVNFT